MSRALATSNGSQVDAPTDPFRLGAVLAKSGFFNDAREEAQAVAKVLAGQELGVPPVAAMAGINVIKGRVTLSANLIAGLVKRHPHYDYRVREMGATGCQIEFLQDGESIGLSEFTDEDAQRAGLTGENWRKFPANMMFARAISNGAKWFCPDVFGGAPVYTPDELGGEVDGETGDVVSVPTVEPAPAPEPEPVAEAEVVDEAREAHIDAVKSHLRTLELTKPRDVNLALGTAGVAAQWEPNPETGRFRGEDLDGLLRGLSDDELGSFGDLLDRDAVAAVNAQAEGEASDA